MFKSSNAEIEDATFCCGHHDKTSARFKQSLGTITGHGIHTYKVGVYLGSVICDEKLPGGSYKDHLPPQANIA